MVRRASGSRSGIFGSQKNAAGPQNGPGRGHRNNIGALGLLRNALTLHPSPPQEVSESTLDLVLLLLIITFLCTAPPLIAKATLGKTSSLIFLFSDTSSLLFSGVLRGAYSFLVVLAASGIGSWINGQFIDGPIALSHISIFASSASLLALVVIPRCFILGSLSGFVMPIIQFISVTLNHFYISASFATCLTAQDPRSSVLYYVFLTVFAFVLALAI